MPSTTNVFTYSVVPVSTSAYYVTIDPYSDYWTFELESSIRDVVPLKSESEEWSEAKVRAKGRVKELLFGVEGLAKNTRGINDKATKEG